MSLCRFAACFAILFSIALFAGCGDSTPTKNTAPTEKQQQKETPGGGGGGGKK